jgi:hypothetical protein
MSARALPTTMPGLRKLSAKEEVQRQASAACMLDVKPSCQQIINVGVFFDGTKTPKQKAL